MGICSVDYSSTYGVHKSFVRHQYGYDWLMLARFPIFIICHIACVLRTLMS
jgi:hypothetical protein